MRTKEVRALVKVLDGIHTRIRLLEANLRSAKPNEWARESPAMACACDLIKGEIKHLEKVYREIKETLP